MFAYTKLMQAMAAAGVVSATDPYFNLTTLLLPGNGTNGAQNNTFLDSSSNNFTITRNGNTTQGTFSPFSQTGWSNYFDGSSNFSFASASTANAMGTGDWTFEAFVYPTVGGGTPFIFDTLAATSGTTVGLRVRLNASNQVELWQYSAAVLTGGTLNLNAWNHVAVTRASGTTRIYVNGTSSTTYADAGNYTCGASRPMIASDGYNSGTQNSFTGYISNLRTVKGTAVYTGASLTVPTAALTAITNTQLLTCQSNRFVDNSSNAFAITVNGTPSVQSFSPFAPTAAYSAATNGGSGYFDGTGDYLTAASNAAWAFGTGDYCVETWYYASASPNVVFFEVDVNTGMSFEATTTYFRTVKAYVGVDVSFSYTFTQGQWYHIAITRQSGTVRGFVNGSLVSSSASNTTSWAQGAISIGRSAGGSGNVTGYLSGLRLVKGSAVYTADFSAPTAPPTAITNTSLLCNFTNAGITDATGKNDLETVGNAQISTTQSKWGGSSMYFDGTGDWLQIPDSNLFPAGTENFTIEFWVYFSATGTIYIAGQCDSSGTLGSQSIAILKTSGEKLQFYCVNGTTQYTCTSSNNLPQTTWTHIACVRNGSTLTQYINGTADGTASISTNSINNSSNRFGVGELGELTSNPMNGYIDDFRITKGYARYTANFTAPTAAFPLQ